MFNEGRYYFHEEGTRNFEAWVCVDLDEPDL